MKCTMCGYEGDFATTCPVCGTPLQPPKKPTLKLQSPEGTTVQPFTPPAERLTEDELSSPKVKEIPVTYNEPYVMKSIPESNSMVSLPRNYIILVLTIATILTGLLTGAFSYLGYLLHPSAYTATDAVIIYSDRDNTSHSRHHRRNYILPEFSQVLYDHNGTRGTEYIKTTLFEREGDTVPIYISASGTAHRRGFIVHDLIIALFIYAIAFRVFLKTPGS